MKKGVSYSDATGLGAGWKPRLNRAYEEGRRQYPSGTNPHVANSPANLAWQHGEDNRADAAYQRDTAVA